MSEVSVSPVVLITGALTGIGRATALAFAADGARIVVSGRRDAEGEALANELHAGGAEALFVRADVRHEDEVKHLVDSTLERFGRIDIAVNNAGTEGTLGPLTEQTADSFDAVFETNVLGVMLSMKHELRAMQTQGSGSIVNLSSVLGKVGTPGASVYVASKHAVEGLTKTAALEMASTGIRVNAVAPGPIETGMINRFVGNNDDAKAGFIQHVPAKRIGTPEEIAQTILFVASSKAPFLTGQSIAVDGGMLA
jgi:NAD(P)-dependent dehydrogenase (short-subunit alcohol dehydrogenase family)